MKGGYTRFYQKKGRRMRQEITPAMEMKASALRDGSVNFTMQLLANNRQKKQIQESLLPRPVQSKQEADDNAGEAQDDGQVKEAATTSRASDTRKEEHSTNQARLRELDTIQPTSYKHAKQIVEERKQLIQMEKHRIAMEEIAIEEKRKIRNKARKNWFKFTSKGQPVMGAYVVSVISQLERERCKQ